MAAVVVLAVLATLAAGGYFKRQAFVLETPENGGNRKLAAVYWSGDMGMGLGNGRGIVDRLLADHIPVLTVSSPTLFAQQRDRGYVDRTVAASVKAALARTGARRLALVGSSFGADILGAGIGDLPAGLRRKIVSVILVVPGTGIYFHANPSGIFYRGPSAVDPALTVPLLHGLPVTCIFATLERDSLCQTLLMAGARRVGFSDGHLLRHHRDQLREAIIDAIAHPPRPMT